MPSKPVELHLPIHSDAELLAARQKARQAASELGFGPKDITSIVTSISELARNMLMYAGSGEVIVRGVNGARGIGLEVIARDDGPGIPDLRRALMDGYSTSGGLGMGLPGVRRLMDEFDVQSESGHGTIVTALKWLEGR